MRLTLYVAVVMAACGDVHVTESGDEAGSSRQELVGGSCSNVDCGLNSGMIEGIYFSEIYKPLPPFLASPLTNNQGFRLAHVYASEAAWFAKTPADAGFDVQLGKVIGVDEGSIIELRRGTATYLIKINKITTEGYWTDPVPGSNQPAIDLYWLEYTLPRFCGPAADGHPVCTNYRPLCKDKEIDNETLLPAVMFEGDRYVQDTLAVMDSPTIGAAWFNIACSGSIPSKMYFIRRTRAAAKDPNAPFLPVPPLPVRQAFVNAWAANYCGDAYSFTETGFPIRIRDLNDTMNVDLGVGFADNNFDTIEAVWGPSGALCLGKPRHPDHDLAAVQEHCASLDPPRVLPECPDDVLSTWTSMPSAVVLTASPNPDP